MAKLEPMMHVENIVVGNSSLNDKYDVPVQKQPAFSGVNLNGRTFASPFRNSRSVWEARVDETSPYGVPGRPWREIIRSKLRSRYFINLYASTYDFCWTLTNIGEPKGYFCGVSTRPKIVGIASIHQEPRAMLHSNLAVNLTDIVRRGVAQLIGENRVANYYQEGAQLNPKQSRFPQSGYLALWLAGAIVLGGGWWYLNFSKHDRGNVIFILANLAVPTGAILCWYGTSGLLVWSAR